MINMCVSFTGSIQNHLYLAVIAWHVIWWYIQ